jgi:carboxylesterase
MKILGQGLASRGYAVYAPRLPGHGTRRSDFLLTNAEDWARRAYDAYLDLRAEYGTVHVAGHSMGGLLATAVAASFDAPRLILLAPAFEVQFEGVNIMSPLNQLITVLRRDRPVAEPDRQDPIRGVLHAEYGADDFPASAYQLGRLVRLGRGKAPQVRSRVLAITGSADATVPPRVADFIRKGMTRARSLDLESIEGAGHIFPFDSHAQAAADIVLNWMGK